MKRIKQIRKKDQEPYRVPKRVQDVIPIKCMWSDGIFLVGTRYSKTFKFTDINYMVASQEAQKKLFLAYAALINSLDCGATTKITLNNRHLNRKNFADTVLMKLKNDYLDYYRMEYNDVIMSKATGGNGIIQEKYGLPCPGEWQQPPDIGHPITSAQAPHRSCVPSLGWLHRGQRTDSRGRLWFRPPRRSVS